MPRVIAAIAALVVIGGLCLGLGSSASACDIPVFRFALDRWDGDLFQLHVAPQRFADIKRAVPDSANVQAVSDDKLSDSAAELWFPTVQGGVKSAGLVWSGTIDEKTLPLIWTSPLRTKIAKRLCQGDSGVWVLLEGSDATANDAAAVLINQALRSVEKTAKLPVLKWAVPENAPGPGPELRIGFSLLRLNPAEAGESATVAMLDDHGKDAPPDRSQPTALLIFGRGHVLVSLKNDQLSAANIQTASRFLLGSCSCEVKDEHPGWDLLMDMSWDAELQRVETQRTATATAPATEPTVRPNATLKPLTIEIHGTTSPSNGSGVVGDSEDLHSLWYKIGAITLALAGIGGIWFMISRSRNRAR